MRYNFKFIAPQDLDELAQYQDDLNFLAQFSPVSVLDFMEWVKWAVPHFVLVYTPKDVVIGCFTLLLYKRTAEIHGIFRQDFRAFKELKHLGPLLADSLVRDVFKTHNKKVLITKVPPEAKAVRGFLIRNGFRKLQKEKDLMVYKLTRDKYINEQ